MKKMLSLMTGLASLALLLAPARAASVDLSKAAEKKGWLLGSQLYCFNKETFLKAVDKAKALGLKYVEIFPGQKFSDEAGKTFNINENTTPDQRALIKKTLDDAGLKAISYGVTTPGNPAAWEKAFAFAKEMGLQYIDSEPADNDATAKLLDQLTQKYGIKIAIHNHPKPAHYWNAQIKLDFIKKANDSKMIGSCTDTGHFVRSGLDPLPEIEKLKDVTYLFHFKDLNAKAGAPNLHDVPWGTGQNNVWAVMNMMDQAGWKGALMAEYEINFSTPQQFAEMRQSYEFLNMVSAALDKDGWTPVFKDDLSNAQMEAPGAWTLKDGVLEPTKAKEDIFSKEAYGDFILDLEFKCAPKTNSGVFIRMSDPKDWLNTGMEVQVLQDTRTDFKENGLHETGALYDVKGVERPNPVKPAGEWNHMTIIARANMIYVMVNGNQVNCINLDKWTVAGKNPDGTSNKFRKTAYKDMPRKGVLALQYHGTPISYRNVKIKTLD